MMTTFVDTSFYVACCSPRDGLHRKATELSQAIRGKFITTEYVLIEVGNWFSRIEDREVFSELIGDLQGDPRTTILEGTHDWYRDGLKRYLQRLDKGWSLTDCISFVVMERLGVNTALTADHHFEQAGFQILL